MIINKMSVINDFNNNNLSNDKVNSCLSSQIISNTESQLGQILRITNDEQKLHELYKFRETIDSFYNKIEEDINNKLINLDKYFDLNGIKNIKNNIKKKKRRKSHKIYRKKENIKELDNININNIKIEIDKNEILDEKFSEVVGKIQPNNVINKDIKKNNLENKLHLNSITDNSTKKNKNME